MAAVRKPWSVISLGKKEAGGRPNILPSTPTSCLLLSLPESHGDISGWAEGETLTAAWPQGNKDRKAPKPKASLNLSVKTGIEALGREKGPMSERLICCQKLEVIASPPCAWVPTSRKLSWERPTDGSRGGTQRQARRRDGTELRLLLAFPMLWDHCSKQPPGVNQACRKGIMGTRLGLQQTL